MKPYYVVLLLMDDEGKALRDFVYPVQFRPLANFLFNIAKKYMEGYH